MSRFKKVVVRVRNASGAGGLCWSRDRLGPVQGRAWGLSIVQTAQPRDVAALALVVGLFLILFIVTVMLGAPTR
jgi:hypothetical protein